MQIIKTKNQDQTNEIKTNELNSYRTITSQYLNNSNFLKILFKM